PDYVYYRDHNQVFSGLLAYSSDPTRVSWSRPGQNEIINGQVVSGNFFSVLGVTPRLGRAFLPEADRTPDKNPVVAPADAFWRNSSRGRTPRATKDGPLPSCPRREFRRSSGFSSFPLRPSSWLLLVWSCSSPARTRPISSWLERPGARAKWLFVPLSAPAAAASSGRS